MEGRSRPTTYFGQNRSKFDLSKITQNALHTAPGSDFEFFDILDLPLGVRGPFPWDLVDSRLSRGGPKMT